MTKVGLFFGSTTGNTETAAEMIQAELGGESVVTACNIADASESDFSEYECLIIATSTWDTGELQADWDGFFEDLDGIDFSGKKVAYFGVGDQIGYSDNFQDAMGTLEEKISSLGGTTVGYWSTDGYEHEASKAEKNGKFVGLALDEDNQSEMTESRIKVWATLIKTEFGI